MLDEQIQDFPARRATAATRPNKRQRYTLVACEKCKKRKIKCSGETPCRQCVKHKSAVCVYDRSSPGNSTPSAVIQRPAGTISCVLNSDSIAQTNALWPLSRQKAKALLETLREDIETLYPFVDLHEMKSLVDMCFDTHAQPWNSESNTQTARWDDLDDGRNLDLLKSLLICALSTERHPENDPSAGFFATVEKNHCGRVQRVDVDIKDVAVATILYLTTDLRNDFRSLLPNIQLTRLKSVYHYQCDNVTLAWRKIGAAAKLCLELGLHRMSNLALEESTRAHLSWETKIFWCVYVLDRRYSFMANLPFTLQDRDIDFELLQADRSAPYLIPMVMFGRLGGKIIPTAPKFGSAYDELNEIVREDLGGEIDRWMETTAIRTSSAQSFGSIYQNLSLRRLRHFNLFFEIRGNQMRLSLYKHSLHTPNSVLKFQNFARRAVRCATENIRILSETKDSNCDVYESLRMHYYFFLTSSLVSLHLAIRNAPQQFSNTVLDYSTGLIMLKSMSATSIASEKLKKTVQTLDNALNGLMFGPVNNWGNSLAPQLQYRMSPIPAANCPPDGKLIEGPKRVDPHSRQPHHFTPSSQDIALMSPIATPQASSNFGPEDNVQLHMHEEERGRNLMQNFSVDDFSMNNVWNISPDVFWNDQAISSGVIEGLPLAI